MMKKMKKLSLNKMRIVSLRNLYTIKGGQTEVSCIQTDTYTTQQDPTTSNDVNACNSTSNTYQDGGNGAGTLKSDFGGETENCTVVVSVCQHVDM